MGNVNMEAYQVHFEGKSVAEKLKELDETVKENEQEIDSLSDIVSIKADRIDIAPIFSEESAYSAGDLVYNSNSLWKFSVDHAAGDWDPSEVSAVNIDMELSELKNTLTAQSVTFTPETGVTIDQAAMYKCSNILLGSLWINVPSNLISASSVVGSFNVSRIPANFRTIGIATTSSIKGQIGHFYFGVSGQLYVDNNYALPGAGKYKLDITVPLSS